MEKIERSLKDGDLSGLEPLQVSHGICRRPGDTRSCTREMRAYTAREIGDNSPDPELEKLWQDIDDYCDADESPNFGRSHLPADEEKSEHSSPFAVAEVNSESRNYDGKAGGHQAIEVPGGPSEFSLWMPTGTGDGGKSLCSSDKHTSVGSVSHSAKISEEAHLSTSIGKRRRLEDTGCKKSTKSLSLSASSKGSSQTKRATGSGSSFWDKMKHRRCRKTPLSELNSRRNGGTQELNSTTLTNAETRQRKISTLQNGSSSIFDKHNTWAQSSCSSNTNEGNDSTGSRDRERVDKTLDLFRALCKELFHEGKSKRIDYKAYRIIKANPEFVDLGKVIGSVPGVDVGDEFHYRMEIALVSLHKPSEAGIDFMSNGTNDIGISIVATAGCGDYLNDMHNPEILIYCGQGGNVGRRRKEPEDQRLEKGNLALKNSIAARNPVRVVRGRRVSGMTGSVYIYDGLYRVETFWQEKAAHGKLVFKFKLRRIPGQPDLRRDQWRKLGAC